ncbi:MAG: NAD(P)-binding protein [Phycisphaera sp.]|nr:NAD(P)-binding protein [Phycisphaera sp.]
MSTQDRYDVIILGSGAGGGTMAYRLAQTGKRILILERGDYLPREKENWDPREVFTKGRYVTKEKWLDSEGNEFTPFTHYYVGGNTKMYGSALLRLRTSDFERVRHIDGYSPEWPLKYADFEPYYTRAEKLYHVHGQAGIDPCEPPRSSPFPHPPVPYEPRMREIADAFRGQGLRPFPCALGVRLPSDHNARRGPVVLSNFDGYPDPTHVKADAEVCCIEDALNQPNVTMLTNRKAIKLETSATGREVTGVVVEHNGQLETFRGDIVVVACGAINSAALLLRSAGEKHPRGLANSSGQVGRNYMTHNNGMCIAISHTPNPSQFQKAFAITDYYHGSTDFPYPMGAIQLMGKPDADFLESLARKHLPGVPAELMWTHTVDFFLTTEDLPRPDNRVELADDGRIRIHYRENNRAAYDKLREKLISHFEAIGCHKCHLHLNAYVGPKLGISGVSHQNGTLRFGEDPTTSVLDLDCRMHDVHNLYVTDASFFPSCGAVNPSLTIMANTLRVGDHIAEQLTGHTQNQQVTV